MSGVAGSLSRPDEAANIAMMAGERAAPKQKSRRFGRRRGAGGRRDPRNVAASYPFAWEPLVAT
jgi:hypothetical protein